MNDNIKVEVTRTRPLSGGIWTLFSWLRREDRSHSRESLSSAGSDRTAISFAFLEPLYYSAATEPIVLPSRSPPTDSYKKRVQDRNFRRQRERDITLHRKYGLFKGENTDRYDAFSLSTAYKNLSGSAYKTERGRRATSESFQRRTPYVPGKRRAPLPPTVSTSLPRNIYRKRPAPQPPFKIAEITKDNILARNNHFESMNSKPGCDTRSMSSNNAGIKNEKNKKEERTKLDKSIIKQFFDQRKRNSGCENNYVKLLPNISELDRQAKKIIENKKTRAVECKPNFSKERKCSMNLDSTDTKEDKLICTECLIKHSPTKSSCVHCRQLKSLHSNDSFSNNADSTTNVVSNIYTQTNNDVTNVASTSKVSGNEDKKKLKEMLKEMKDSLPKRPKHNMAITESPTLRIGSPDNTDKLKAHTESPSNNVSILKSSDVVKTEINKEELSSSPKKTISNILSIGNNGNNQPLLIGTSPNNLITTFTSQTEIKNMDSNCELSVLKKDAQSTNKSLDLKNREFNPNSVTTVTNKIFNIPVSNINTKDSKQNKLTNTQTEIVSKEKNNKTETTLQLHTSVNILNKNVLGVTTESQNAGQRTSTTLHLQSSDLSSREHNSNLPNKEGRKKESKEIIAPFNSYNFQIPEKTTPKVCFENKDVNKNKDFTRHSINSVIEKVRPTEIVAVDENNLESGILKSTIKSSIEKPSIHMPLKISSLLNPIYRPMETNSLTHETLQNIKETSKFSVTPLKSPVISQDLSKTAKLKEKPLQTITEICEKNKAEPKEKELNISSSTISNQYNTNASVCKVLGVVPSSSKADISLTNDSGRLDHHSRRRELVNQLEQSIAKGDEQAAADAAIKLAKLRLSCSVLSFSSQITKNHSESSKPAVPFRELLATNRENEPFKKCTELNMDAKTTAQNYVVEAAKVTKNLKKNNVEEDIVKASTSKVKEWDINNRADAIIVQNETAHKPLTAKHSPAENGTFIQIWVEDKEATRGPISLQISRQANMGELRRQAENLLGLDTRLQRWIIGHTLCTDDAELLVSLAGPEFSAPFYLCLVESESVNETERKQKASKINSNTSEVYNELIKLEQQAIVPNSETFECGVCMEECEAGRGAVLRECIHSFCRDCLSDVIRHCEEPVVACPATGCPGILQEREIRALLTKDEYDRWLARGLATAECGTRNAFHCRTRDCSGWALCDPGVRKFPCPVCKCNNCVPCQAIHENETCEQYQAKLPTSDTATQRNETDEGTRAFLNSLIRRGEALECPECHAVITKKWGCDWVKCSACKTEICWVTRGRRWGPAGRGDTSAGCKCGVDGKKCHPSCGYCH